MRHLPLVFLALLAGCATPTIIRFNGQVFEYERLESAIFPEGSRITRMDDKIIEVKGTVPIIINGKEVWADANGVRIGKRELKVAIVDTLVVDKRGNVHVIDKPKPSLPASTSPAVVERNTGPDEVAEAREAPEAGSQEDTSMWSFLR